MTVTLCHDNSEEGKRISKQLAEVCDVYSKKDRTIQRLLCLQGNITCMES